MLVEVFKRKRETCGILYFFKSFSLKKVTILLVTLLKKKITCFRTEIKSGKISAQVTKD